MDIHFHHPTDIFVLKPCHSPDATDLIALGGSHTLEVLSVGQTDFRVIASFHIGTRVTAISWSSATVSPTKSDQWTLKLACATEDRGLHLLTKSSTEVENILQFHGELSGHYGTVNGMAFCGGWSEDSSRYLATISDDKTMMVWDLYPPVPPKPLDDDDDDSMNNDSSDDTPDPRPQPTAYCIPFPHALTSISSHPTTSKQFLVSDSKGSLYVIDWRSDAEDMMEEGSLRRSTLVELVEPYAMSTACLSDTRQWSGSSDWRSDKKDIIGAVFGNRFSLWDLSEMKGGKPTHSYQGTFEAGNRFRFSRTFPEYFAISSPSPTRGAQIHIYNYTFIEAQPTVLTIRERPQFVRDFDWLSLPGIPRIAVAVGKTLIVFPIGEAI